MITHDKIISMKLPSNLLRLMDEKIKEHRINRSTFLRSLVLMALRDEIVEMAAKTHRSPNTMKKSLTMVLHGDQV